MLIKWCIGGAMVGFLLWLFKGHGVDQAASATIVGGAAGIALRKWIARTFWV